MLVTVNKHVLKNGLSLKFDISCVRDDKLCLFCVSIRNDKSLQGYFRVKFKCFYDDISRKLKLS